MKKYFWSSYIYILLIILLALQYSMATLAGDTLINPGFETVGSSPNKALGWLDFGTGYQRIAGGRISRWSIKLQNSSVAQFAGAYQRVDLNQSVLKPVQVSGYVRGSGITNQVGGFLDASLYAEIHMQDESIAYWNSIANLGTFNWRKIGFNTGSLGSVNKPISYIFIIPILGSASGIAYFDDLTIKQYTPTQSAVTIMFDDGENSAFTLGFPQLEKYNLVGSSAIITDLIDEPGYMTTDQLKTLQSNGWEMISHTVSHTDLTTLGQIGLDQELLNSKRALLERGLNVKNLALPFGAYNAAVLASASRYYQSVRAFEQGDNPQGLLPFDVKVRGVINTTTPNDLSGWIADAQLNNRWLVLVFHSITDSGDDQFHTSPAVFDQMVKTIADSQVPVVTYDKGIGLFGAK